MLAMLLVIYIASKWSECTGKNDNSIQSYTFIFDLFIALVI